MGQMVPEKLPDTDLVDSVDCKIRLGHPPREVRDAGNVVVRSADRVAALLQVLEERLDVRSKSAAA